MDKDEEAVMEKLLELMEIEHPDPQEDPANITADDVMKEIWLAQRVLAKHPELGYKIKIDGKEFKLMRITH